MVNRIALTVLNADNKPPENYVLREVVNNFSETYEITLIDAESENALFSALDEGNINLVLLDIKWGTLDSDTVPYGAELLRGIRESSHRDIPVIVVTSYELEGYQRLFLEMGCDGFLSKGQDYRRVRLPSLEHVFTKALKASELRKHVTPNGLELKRKDDEGREQVTRLFGTSAPMIFARVGKKSWMAIISLVTEGLIFPGHLIIPTVRIEPS